MKILKTAANGCFLLTASSASKYMSEVNTLIQCAEEYSAESLNTFFQKYGSLI